MASPQLENGYTRTSNELSEAIMQSDFSKRQRNILDLIIRMSYGCGKKSALLRLSDFELVGVYKVDVKKELEYLEKAHVIVADKEDDFFRLSLNKNYDQWRIDIIRTFSTEKWDQVLQRNLSDQPVSKILTEVNEILLKEETGVSEILIEQKCSVSKILTEAPLKTNDDADFQPPKEIDLKESKREEEEESKTPLIPQYTFKDVVHTFESNIGTIGKTERDDLVEWSDHVDCGVIVLAIKEAARNRGRNMKYINKVLGDWTSNNVKTTEQAEALLLERQRGNGRDSPNSRSGTVIQIDPVVRELLDVYRSLFQNYHGAAPIIKESRDGEKILEMLKNNSKEDSKKLIELYLADSDPYLKERGHPIALMISQLNKYIVQLQENKKEFGDIDLAEYPGGSGCKCGGTGWITDFDPLANNGSGAHRSKQCPCQKIPKFSLAVK